MWSKPCTIDELLNGFHKSHKRKNISKDDWIPNENWIPNGKSVYLVSKKNWRKKPNDEPTKECEPLYVGSITGESERFRTRIGDLIADMFGFYNNKKIGHHSGGQALHKYCIDHKLNPKKLYISWLKSCSCHRCMENKIFDQLEDRPRSLDKKKRRLLNQKRPNRCKTKHKK
jgi:hypothetical protein